MDLKNWLRGLKRAFVSLSTPHRILLSLFLGALIFTLIVLSSRPGYSMQLLGQNILYLPRAVKDLYLYNTSGYINMALTGIYGVLAGLALTSALIQLKSGKVDLTSVSSIGPGFLASGCAGCGAGLLGFIGLGSSLAALPFHGNEIMIGGIGLLLFFLGRSGDPEVCEFNPG